MDFFRLHGVMECWSSDTAGTQNPLHSNTERVTRNLYQTCHSTIPWPRPSFIGITLESSITEY